MKGEIYINCAEILTSDLLRKRIKLLMTSQNMFDFFLSIIDVSITKFESICSERSVWRSFMTRFFLRDVGVARIPIVAS